ncbi:uncharacterized protein LOC127866107 isoform X2 [Dreissena polymorpha]|uniref:Uncharacterized protein n=1 Tax=Dreissena polymorpha TaxID=45954 RepID=A0A9D4LPQ5_DREPO|nr:uncharacterized protein LOC127866107 isoform X2 [Dreissena polymorpha]KAH3861925.1 hypothetical protein DPMN_024879 [Dreissena polymorpha]
MVPRNMKQLLFGLALMLHVSQSMTDGTTVITPTSTQTSSTTTSRTTSAASKSTDSTTFAALAGSSSATTIPAGGKKTDAPTTTVSTAFAPYPCNNGTCEGNETCIKSTIRGSCSITGDVQGCFRTQHDTHFEVGCRPNCDTNKNTKEDWCCRGKSDCIFESMPPPGGNANTVVSRSFLLLGTIALVLFVM